MRLMSVAVCLLVTGAGCSLVIGTDGLSGEAPGAGPSDAAADTSEASLDGAQGSDAADAGDAAKRGCGLYPDATFCQDFDDPATALSTTTWTDTDVGQPKGTITLVPTGAVSAPNAARIALLTASSNCEYEQLTKELPGSFATLTTRISVRPEADGIFLAVIAAPSTLVPPTYRILVAFDRPTGATAKLYAFVQKHDTGVFSDFSSGALPLGTDPFGRNLDVSVELTAGPNPKVTLREGSTPLTLGAPADLAITNARVQLGAYCRDTPATFTFDDVAIWAGP